MFIRHHIGSVFESHFAQGKAGELLWQVRRMGNVFKAPDLQNRKAVLEEFIRIISFFFPSFIPSPGFLWLRVRVSVCYQDILGQGIPA